MLVAHLAVEHRPFPSSPLQFASGKLPLSPPFPLSHLATREFASTRRSRGLASLFVLFAYSLVWVLALAFGAPLRINGGGRSTMRRAPTGPFPFFLILLLLPTL